MRKIIKIWCIILLTSLTLIAEIINVPSDYSEIQDAINSAKDCDTVIVAPGTYEQQIFLTGKNITLSSLFLLTNDTTYIDSTILSYSLNSRNTIYCGGLDSSSVITGFTIGSDVLVCKGIECDNSSPLIKKNVFKTGNDYGILCRENSKPAIRENKFLTARSMYYCIEVRQGNAIIQNNIFHGKTYSYSSAIRIASDETISISGNEICNFRFGIDDYGNRTKIINNLIYNCEIGICCVDAILINNTVVNNIDRGIQNIMQGIPEIINCIIWGNKIDFFGVFSISNSCMWGCLPYAAIDNGGNVFKDPKFISDSKYNFRLKGESPCIDTGRTDSDLIPEFDIEYNNRVSDGNGDNISIIDIGCFEKEQAINPAYVSGKITLVGGSGKVEEVSVGIGSLVHPDLNGNYLFAVSVPDSVYSVFASHDDYLGQEINNVSIKAGEITQNIDFNLEYYNPDKIHSILPDTLRFVPDNGYCNEIKIKNISLSDIYVRWIQTSSMLYFDEDYFSIPHYIGPGDSCELVFCLNLLSGSAITEFVSDSVIVYFNSDTAICPVLIDPSLIDGIELEKNEQPTFYISQNFPNPFNTQTTIELITKIKSDVKIEIFNIAGQKIRSLKKDGLNAGKHSFVWDGKDDSGNILSTGLYFYVIKDTHNKQINKMIMLK